MKFRQLLAAAVILAAGLALGQTSAEAQDRAFLVNTTEDLHNLCTMPDGAAMRTEAINYCMAYMDGAVDYHDVLTTGDNDEMKPIVCYPETATLELGVVTFIEWGNSMRDDRKLMDEPPVLGVLRALSKKWPC